MEINYIMLSIVVISNIVGALVRVFFEINNDTHTKSKSVLTFVASFAMMFVAYEIIINFDLEKWVGLIGVLSGIVGISLVKIVIEEVPEMVLSKLENILNKKRSDK